VAPTWHDWIAAGMARLSAARVPSTLLRGDVLRYGSGAICGPAQLQLSLAGRAEVPAPPAWLHQTVAAEPAPARSARPSRMAEDEEPAVPSPLLAAAGGGRARGRIVHRLLQVLPGRPPEQWAPLLGSLLADPALALDPEEQRALGDEVRRVLAMPQLVAAFGPNSRAEVPLAGMVGDQAVFGQVDRLAISGTEVLIVDYKTDREPPGAPDRVPVAYLRQMAAYRALLRRIYPGRAVRCTLLWTAGPQLMTLDEATLAGYAPVDAQA
jgi:ATP-dependent helicase/nuclease subunit A